MSKNFKNLKDKLLYKWSRNYRETLKNREILNKLYNELLIRRNSISINKHEALNSKKEKIGEEQEFYSKCEQLFVETINNTNYKRNLCQRFLEMAQGDIIKNLCDYIINSKEFLIYDIGASEGWFSKLALERESVRNSYIIAYEPIREMRKNLESIKGEFNNFSFKNKGIGNKKEKLVLKENDAITGLSSFLNIKEDYKYFAFNLKDTSIQNEIYESEIEKLSDEYCKSDIAQKYKNIALKIDVQGFEMQVLEGARELFEKKLIKAVLIELTTVEKYNGATTYEKIMDFMHKNNFVIFDLLPFYREIKGEFRQDNIGHMTEFDAIFIERDFLKNNKV